MNEFTLLTVVLEYPNDLVYDKRNGLLTQIAQSTLAGHRVVSVLAGEWNYKPIPHPGHSYITCPPDSKCFSKEKTSFVVENVNILVAGLFPWTEMNTAYRLNDNAYLSVVAGKSIIYDPDSPGIPLDPTTAKEIARKYWSI